jgi:DHA1 family bicyclomycin/chloramphenicol resistance-like MFS transporter
MLVLVAIVATGFVLRMPETLHPEYRFPFSMRRILDGAVQTVKTRAALGYASATGLMMGVLFGYLNSSQQIFQTEVYGLGPLFPLAFGAIAAVLGGASYVNSRLVRRLGGLAHFESRIHPWPRSCWDRGDRGGRRSRCSDRCWRRACSS